VSIAAPASPADAAAAAAAVAPIVPAAGTEPAPVAAPVVAEPVARNLNDGSTPPTAEQITEWGSEKAAAEVIRLNRKLGDDRIQSKKNAAEEATKTATESTLAAVAKALGIALPGSEAPTLESVTQQLAESGTANTATTGERDTARKSLALTQAAWSEGVNPEKMDYLEFKLGKDADYLALDSADPEYQGMVKAAIAAIITADGSLKLAGQVTVSGAESFGGASGDDAITPAEFKGMPLGARTALKSRNPAAYTRLTAAQ